MTTPAELTQAVLNMGYVAEHLRPYVSRKADRVLVPRALLISLYWCLRHYPTSADMDEAARRAPKVFGRSLP